MTKKEEKKFIEECRSWIPTAWMHGVGVKNYRSDCIHYIFGVAKNMGWIDRSYEIPFYPHDWALHQPESRLVKELHKHCKLEKLENIKIGDLILYQFGKCESHIAWYLGDGKAIHCVEGYGVVEFDFNSEMREKLRSVMRARKIGG